MSPHEVSQERGASRKVDQPHAFRDHPDPARRLLGSSPLWTALLHWALAVLCSLGAWHLHQIAPLTGMVAMGLAPFLNIYLFFRGCTFMGRALTHWKSLRLARRLRLKPDWGSASGGYLLVDEGQGLWLVNGRSGRLDQIDLLPVSRQEDAAFLLELHAESPGEEKATEKTRPPLATVALGSAEELERVAERLRHAILAARGGAAGKD